MAASIANKLKNMIKGDKKESSKPTIEKLLKLTIPKEMKFIEKNEQEPKKKLVCYFTNWSEYREGLGKFKPQNIDPNLCDVIIFSYGLLENDKIKMDYDDDSLIDKIMEHRKLNTELKILLSIGGWSNGSAAFSDMVLTKESRKPFIHTSIEYLKKRQFDGIDISWKYPTDREGSRPDDKHNFTLLLKELRGACDKHNLILTAAISAAKYYIEKSYEIAEIAKYLDWINFMTYDFHGNWEEKIGFNTPMYDRNEEDDDEYSNVDSAVKYMIVKGVPREKIYLGLATYGRSFTLENQNNRRPGDRALRGGDPGEFTKEEGLLSYYEIRNNVEKNSWTEIFDPVQKVPYAYKGNQWVGYDSVQSIKLKAKYIIGENLGGAHVWTLDFDDFKGVTGDCITRFPLISAARDVLMGLPEKSEESEDLSKYDVFISYCWAQKEIVQNLLYILEREDFRCWIDKSYLLPGSQLSKSLKTAILNSTVVISCISLEYCKSTACSQELDFSKQNNKKIVPVMFTAGTYREFNEEFKKTEIAFLLKSSILETGIYSSLIKPDIKTTYNSNKEMMRFIDVLKSLIKEDH